MEPSSPFVMDVLRRVGEHGEPPERPDQVELLGDRPGREGAAKAGERAAAVTSRIDGASADVLDQVEHVVAGLGAQDVAKEATEQPDVVAERVILGARASGTVVVGR
jgi:hypothetical protein